MKLTGNNLNKNSRIFILMHKIGNMHKDEARILVNSGYITNRNKLNSFYRLHYSLSH